MENKRYEYRTPILIILDHLKPEPSLGEDKPVKGYICELSASGCRIESGMKEKLLPGQGLVTSFVLLSGYTILNAHLKVIRLLEAKKGKQLVACQFINLPEIDQFKIREFIIWKESAQEQE